MIYFTADTHFGDDRLNLYHRDLLFDNVELVDDYMKLKWNQIVRRDDTVYHLGDVAMNEKSLEVVKELNGKKILILGNYDRDIDQDILRKYFDNILKTKMFELKNGETVHLVHEPTECQQVTLNICGHIHGLWQVQRNTINVGVDAWNFTPVSEDLIIWKINAIRKYYDDNVFAGELECNVRHIPAEKKKAVKDLLKGVLRNL